MPIKVPETLPAVTALENENIFVIKEMRAIHQDIRPLKIVVLNLMPTKIVTETQLIRLLSNSSLQVELTLLYPDTAHKPHNTPEEHMQQFYSSFAEIKSKKFDGMIITGAPVEKLEFEEVAYWNELCEIFEWSKSNVYSTIHICWAAQAALFYHYGIHKYDLQKKAFGIFSHKVLEPRHPILRGFSEVFYAPHSRHTAIDEKEVAACSDIQVLAKSDKVGSFLLADKNMRRYYITGHIEYDNDTLAKEYFRDIEKGREIDIPENYFPKDDVSLRPINRWRSEAHMLFENWLNHCVYQLTPYNIDQIHE